jgi:hypothetical protein
MFTAKKDIIGGSDLPIHPELEKLLEIWLEENFVSNSHKESIIS